MAKMRKKYGLQRETQQSGDLGGFLGSDPILNTTSLAKLVSNNTIRFFLLNGRTQTSNQQAARQNNGAPGQNALGGAPAVGRTASLPGFRITAQ